MGCFGLALEMCLWVWNPQRYQAQLGLETGQQRHTKTTKCSLLGHTTILGLEPCWPSQKVWVLGQSAEVAMGQKPSRTPQIVAPACFAMATPRHSVRSLLPSNAGLPPSNWSSKQCCQAPSPSCPETKTDASRRLEYLYWYLYSVVQWHPVSLLSLVAPLRMVQAPKRVP